MILALVAKLALLILGIFVIASGIRRRKEQGTSFRRDPVVDRLFRLLAVVGAVFLMSLVLGGIARVRQWPSWIGDTFDAIVLVAIVVAFVCGPILGWKLVGEQHGNPPG